jgi:hypothetical protein
MCNLFHFDGKLIDGLEFCSEVYAVFENIRKEPEGRDRLRSRASPMEKRLLEELLPICRYIQTYYRAGRYISVRWVDGSQSFDAELHQKGDYIDYGYYPELAYLEVTTAMHKNEHWTWKLNGSFAPEGIVKRKGKPVCSEPVVFTNQEHVENFVPIVLDQILKKSNIDYPENTSLVIQCHLYSLYTPDDLELLVKQIKNKLPDHSFREVLIFDGTTERTTRLV